MHINRTISILGALTLSSIVNTTAVAGDAPTRLSLPAVVSGAPGSDVLVAVTIASAVPDPQGPTVLQTEMTLSPRPPNGFTFTALTLAPRLDTIKMLVSGQMGQRSVRGVVYGLNQARISDGDLETLRVHIAAAVPPGDYPIIFSEGPDPWAIVADQNGQEVRPVGFTTGIIRVVGSSNPPGPVTNFHAVGVARQRIELSWEHDGLRLVGFKLERSGNGGSSWDTPRSLLATARTYVDTQSVPQLTRTRYRIVAVNADDVPSTPVIAAVERDGSGVADFDVQMPEEVQQRQVDAGITVTMNPNREVRLVVVRQGRTEPLLDEIIRTGTITRPLRNLAVGMNTLTFTLKDLVGGATIGDPVVKEVTVRERSGGITFTLNPDFQRARSHRGIRHGFPLTIDVLGGFSRVGVTCTEPQLVKISRLRDAMDRPSTEVLDVQTEIEGASLHIKQPNGDPISLATHSSYRIELNNPGSCGVGGDVATTINGLPMSVRTRPNPNEPHALIGSADVRHSVYFPSQSVPDNVYALLADRSEYFLTDSNLLERIRDAGRRLPGNSLVDGRVMELTFARTDADSFFNGSLRGNIRVMFPTSGGLSGVPELDSRAPSAQQSYRIARLNGDALEVLNSTLNSDGTVSVLTDRGGVYVLVNGVPVTPNTSIYPFPVPFAPARDSSQRNILFNNTPRGTHIKIFTVNGDLVKELTTGDDSNQTPWDVTTIGGDKVASDVYLYTATDPNGGKKTGKLVIIR